jgi:uncharacterized protein YceK
MRTSRSAIVGVFVGFTMLISGCGSVVNLRSSQSIYGGVMNDIDFLISPGLTSLLPFDFIFDILCIVDLVVCAVIDTLLLPFLF